MEVIDIFVEYASGITITDRATFVPDLGEVCVSNRLVALVREFALTKGSVPLTALSQDQLDALTVAEA